MITVRIQHGSAPAVDVKARTDSAAVAISRAVRRVFGPRAVFLDDGSGSGLDRYGQVIERPARGKGESRAITGRVSVHLAGGINHF